MRIAVWRTGHEIADTVADAVQRGMPWDGVSLPTQIYETNMPGYHFAPAIAEHNINIAYGILRGTADVFRKCDGQGKPWLHLDRGYFHPSHYDGYYRVSLCGTQQTFGWPEPDYDRLAALKLDIKPWRGNKGDYTLICPPTKEAAAFFGIDAEAWINWAINTAESNWSLGNGLSSIRTKNSPTSLADHLSGARAVLTFNSSVGWQALQAGIPCVSDPTHSIVGAYFAKLTDKLPQNHQLLSDLQYAHRERLFAIMAGLQLTLEEIRQGKLWEVTNRLLAGSASIAESPRQATSVPIASSAAPSLKSIYAT